jgi:hypothetical protein
LFLQAKVVCRQLGFPDAESATATSAYGQLIANVFAYGNVQCAGTEATLVMFSAKINYHTIPSST